MDALQILEALLKILEILKFVLDLIIFFWHHLQGWLTGM